MLFAPGARIGKFEVVSVLGAGSMGEVYRARDSKLNRDVALKVLPAGMLADEAAELAQREGLPVLESQFRVAEKYGVDFFQVKASSVGALKDADVVLLSITTGGQESDFRSFEVCAKYGIPVGVGDTYFVRVGVRVRVGVCVMVGVCVRVGVRLGVRVGPVAVGEVVTGVLRKAGIAKTDVDAYWLGTAVSGMTGMTLSRPLRIEGRAVTRVENACGRRSTMKKSRAKTTTKPMAVANCSQIGTFML